MDSAPLPNQIPPTVNLGPINDASATTNPLQASELPELPIVPPAAPERPELPDIPIIPELPIAEPNFIWGKKDARQFTNELDKAY